LGKVFITLNGAPKYRYQMFKKEENKKLCESILGKIAQRHGIIIVEMAVMPDHIHLIADVPPTMSISQAFHLLKGASSHELFKRQPKFRLRYPRGHFWSPGKFYRTAGDADTETAINYARRHMVNQTTLNAFRQPFPS